VLREAGWPTPEDPPPGAEEQVADRLAEEAATLISCAEWLVSLASGERPVVNCRPDTDLPASDYVAVDQDRVIQVLRRIAYDLEELARSRRATDLSSSKNDADQRLWLRRRLAEPLSKSHDVGQVSAKAAKPGRITSPACGGPDSRSPRIHTVISTVHESERLKPVSWTNTPQNPKLNTLLAL